MIVENTREFMNMLANSGFSNGDYLKWAAQQVEEVKISSVEDLPKDIRDKAKGMRRRLRLKGCFQNAYLLCTHIPGVRYVGGYYDSMGIPLDHAFNSCNGIYFDAGNELNGLEIEGYDYWKIIEVSAQQAAKMILKIQRYDPLIELYYKMFVKKEHNESRKN